MGRTKSAKSGFTLIELLVVVSVIWALLAIFIPVMARVPASAKSVICPSRMRTFGQGLVLYANANRDVLPPARLPNLDDDRWRSRILGGVKYRPTFLTIMALGIANREMSPPMCLLNARFLRQPLPHAFVLTSLLPYLPFRNSAEAVREMLHRPKLNGVSNPDPFPL